jgi:hypothetical protein
VGVCCFQQENFIDFYELKSADDNNIKPKKIFKSKKIIWVSFKGSLIQKTENLPHASICFIRINISSRSIFQAVMANTLDRISQKEVLI